MRRLGFRARLFIILSLFAALPGLVLTVVWLGTFTQVLPVLGGTEAWERTAATGEVALATARRYALTPTEIAALDAHEQELASSLTQATRLRYLASRAVPVAGVLALLLLGLIVLGASRVAGHLSRQLSRPLDELVGWTENIARGEPLPETPPRRGAPEFAILRARMRDMARDLAAGRERELEVERLRAFRETTRHIAHELKNPLTPIRFAVARLRRDAPESLAEPVEVLDVESARLERMARDFSTFGRLLEGPPAPVDVAELVRYASRSVVPPEVSLLVEIQPGLPMVAGHHDALARALSNVLLNALDACMHSAEHGREPRIAVVASVQPLRGRAGVLIEVTDSGSGIPPEVLEHIWEPYVTTKPTGTGLGLAIVRQVTAAHDGRVHAESMPDGGTRVAMHLPAHVNQPT